MTAVAAPPAGTTQPLALNPLALCLNENPYPPLPAVRAALVRSIASANRYPEFLPERLRALVAGHVGVPEEQVILGAGATGVMSHVLHAITDPGDRIVVPTPAFEGYEIVASMNRLDTVRIPLLATGHHDLPAMDDAARGARAVVLCRPHNPTGTIESQHDVSRLLARVSTDTIVLLDEAYVEFIDPVHRIDAVGLVRRHPNLVVLRTFSKAYGLAGLRIGYAFSSAALAGRLWAMQLPFGIGVTGLVAVTASYAAEAQLRDRIRLITDERRRLQSRLRGMGVRSTDCHANFVYLPECGRHWREVFEHRGVRVKHCPDGGVRITIGGPYSTDPVLAALAGRRT